MSSSHPLVYSDVPPAQETEIVTAIQAFTDDVFKLKSDWEKAIATLSILPRADPSILSVPFETYLQFIKVAQDSAMEARARVLQYFIGIIVGSARDPKCLLENKLKRTKHFLKTLEKVGPPKWTSEQTTKLSESIQYAVTYLESYEKHEGFETIIDSERSIASKEVVNMPKKQVQLRGQVIAPIRHWFFGGQDAELLIKVDEPINDDEKLSRDIAEKEREVELLKEAQTKTKDDRQKAREVLETVQSLPAKFESISRKLGEVCVITEQIKTTVSVWSAFLSSPAAKEGGLLQDSVQSLAVSGDMYKPIALALGDFVSRQS